MTTAWLVALECLEREAEQLEEAVEDGAIELGEVGALPASARAALGPLPDALRDRAAHVHERLARVEQLLAGNLRRQRQGLALADRMGAAHEQPRFLDARG